MQLFQYLSKNRVSAQALAARSADGLHATVNGRGKLASPRAHRNRYAGPVIERTRHDLASKIFVLPAARGRPGDDGHRAGAPEA